MTAVRRFLTPLVHRRWLGSGMVFWSLTHSTAEGNLFSEFVWLICFSLVRPLKLNVFVFSHDFGLSVSCRISWLKGERPGTRTLAAYRQKNTVGPAQFNMAILTWRFFNVCHECVRILKVGEPRQLVNCSRAQATVNNICEFVLFSFQKVLARCNLANVAPHSRSLVPLAKISFLYRGWQPLR